MSALPQMVSYYNEQTRISIVVPKEWTGEVIDKSQFRLFGLTESGFEDYFDEYRPTMSYTIAEPESMEPDWFDKMIAETGKNMALDYNEYQLIDEEWFEVSGRKSFLRHYEWRDEDTQLQLLQLQSMIYASPSRFYLVNAAVLKPLMDKYLPIFDTILKSTRIIPA